MAFKESLCAPRNYIRLPVVSGHPEERRGLILEVYHGFGHVFRRFALFLAWAPSGIVQMAGSTNWQHKVEESAEELGESVQAKSRRYFRFQIFAVRHFVAAHSTELVPDCRAFRGILSASSSFFITETYSAAVSPDCTGAAVNSDDMATCASDIESGVTSPSSMPADSLALFFLFCR